MSDETLITVDNLSKKFCRDLMRSLFYGIEDTFLDLTGRSLADKPLRPKEFWAVQGVSFELKRGECLGLIGRNGAGKTTLLKLLNGLIKPDEGRITMRGRIGALIALGAGFNPLLTGRENIYISGSILGISKRELDARYDEIVEFAEMAEFMDSPVRNYSSGMQVKLGFSVATALDPDILILDEVLAVGDVAFRNKCYNRVGELMKKAAVIFVSHDMNHIAQISSKVLVMHRSQPVFYGDVDDGIEEYRVRNQINQGLAHDSLEQLSEELETVEFRIPPGTITYGGELEMDFVVHARKAIPNVTLLVDGHDPQGHAVFKAHGRDQRLRFDLKPGENRLRLRLGPLHLRVGKVRLSAYIVDYTGAKHYYTSNKMHEFEFDGLGGTGPWYVPELEQVPADAPALTAMRS